jgi:hypothetical protein
MRRLLLAAAILGVPTVASSAQYYTTPYATPGVAVTTPGVVVTAPAAPLVQGQVYLAPGATYVAPGQQYSDQPIIIEGRRYYRDCWWDWGQRRCELKPWW